MRKKEEILHLLPEDLSMVEDYNETQLIQLRIKFGILEALLDIRDIFDGHFNPIGNECNAVVGSDNSLDVCGYSNPLSATNCGDCGADLNS